MLLQSAAKALEQNPNWAVAAQTLGRTQLNFGEVLLAVDSFRHALHLHDSAQMPSGDPRAISPEQAKGFAQRQCVLAFSHKPAEAALGGVPSCAGGAAGGDSISNDAAYFDPPTQALSVNRKLAATDSHAPITSSQSSQAAAAAAAPSTYPASLPDPQRPDSSDETGSAIFDDWISALALARKWRKEVLPNVHVALSVQLSGLAQLRTERATVTGTRPNMEPSAAATDYPEGLLYKRATVK